MVSGLSLVPPEAHTGQSGHTRHRIIETVLGVLRRMEMLWRDGDVRSRPERPAARTAEVGDLTTREPVVIATGRCQQLLLHVSAVTHIWFVIPEPLTAQRERGTSRK